MNVLAATPFRFDHELLRLAEPFVEVELDPVGVDAAADDCYPRSRAKGVRDLRDHWLVVEVSDLKWSEGNVFPGFTWETSYAHR